MKVIIKRDTNTIINVTAPPMICTKKDPSISVYRCSTKNANAAVKPIVKSL